MKVPFKVGDRVKSIKQDYLGTVTWVKFEPNGVMVNRKRRGSHKWDYVQKVEKGGYTVTVSWDPTPVCRLHTMQNAKVLELIALEPQLNNPEEGNNMDSNPIPTNTKKEAEMPKVHNKHKNTAPPDAVYIGRGSKWGNPFVIDKHGSRSEVIAKYEEYILGKPELLAQLHELKGKDVVCYCTPQACHGDILVHMANNPEEGTTMKCDKNPLKTIKHHTWRSDYMPDNSIKEYCKWCGVNKKDLTTTNPEEGTMKYEMVYDLGWVPTLCLSHLYKLYMSDKSGVTFQQWKESRKVQSVITDDLCEFCVQDKDGLNIEINTTNPEEGNKMDTNPTTTNPEEGSTMKYELNYVWHPIVCLFHIGELYKSNKSGMSFFQWKEKWAKSIITDDPCEFCAQDQHGLNIEITTTNPKEGNKMEAKPIYHIAFTGHRPNKLGGYDDNSPKRLALRQQIEETLQRAVVKYGTTHQIIVISGGALGVDQDAARVAYKMNIPFVVAQPCKNHESKWPKESQIKYNKMLELAIQVVLVSDGTYTELGAKCMQDRNIWMVDNCNALIAVWDGTSGGTANCVQYAQKVGKPIVFINPNNLGGNSTNNTERSAS